MVMSPADVSSRTDIFSVVVAKRAPKVESRVTRCDLSAAPVGMLGPSTAAAASFLPNSLQTIFHQPGSLVITAILTTITLEMTYRRIQWRELSLQSPSSHRRRLLSSQVDEHYLEDDWKLDTFAIHLSPDT
jgi:hypothetical protein